MTRMKTTNKSKTKKVKPTQPEALPAASELLPEEHDLGLVDLRMPETSKLTLNWLDAERRALANESKIKQHELDSVLKAIDPEGRVLRLQGEIRSLLMSAHRMSEQFVQESKKVAESLGLDQTAQWSFDDITGKIHVHEVTPVATEPEIETPKK